MNYGLDNKVEVVVFILVWVGVCIKSLMIEYWMLMLAHDAIDDWQWPAMTMTFIVFKNVDF